MCRLFGMSGGREPVRATFWLLEAPDSLAAQSHREPDGTGLGTFDPHDRPVVAKQPLAAYDDADFATEAREVSSRTFVAHVRYASNGGLSVANTHPFQQDGRLFAHNGVIGDVPALEAELGPAMADVHGDTDSERFFALITRETAAHGGDVGAGITAAARWVAAHLPVLSLNCIVITPDELWALRYPATHELHLLERESGGDDGNRRLAHSSQSHRIKVDSAQLADQRAVVVASEEMDDDPGWNMLEPGELIRVTPGLDVERVRILDGPPARPLTLAELDPRAAASQQTQAGGS